MNLPNALTVGRIAATPFLVLLPMADSAALRGLAFALFLAAAVSDYIDGRLARSRQQETDLGRLLDPLADKLLLVGTIIPMVALGGTAWFQPVPRLGLASLPFSTPLGAVGLPWWIVVVVLGRELFMTAFRQAAARRGFVIAAIGPAKWKTAVQLLWQGSAYCWFWVATVALDRHWDSFGWRSFALFNGSVGVAAMLVAVALTLYSLWLYVRRYGSIFAASHSSPPAPPHAR